MTSESLSTPLPRKVRQGSLERTGLVLETALSESFKVKWEEMAFGFLGKVEQKEESTQASSSKRGINVVRTAAMLAGGPLGTAVYDLTRKREKPLPASGSSSFLLLDLYLKNSPQPFRFDSTGTNFKAFLEGETGYSGELNLLNFLRKISPFIRSIQDQSISHFFEKGKGAIPVFPSRDAFSWDSRNAFRKFPPGTE